MPILPSGRYGKRSKPVRCAKAPLTRFGSVLRGTMRPYELHLWQLHCETVPSAPRRSSHRLAAVPRPGSGVPATIQRHPYAEVKKKRSSERLCPAEPSRDLRLGLSVPSSPSSLAGRHTRFRAIKEKLKFFEIFFGPKHIYFCSDFLTKTSPLAVSHLYHAPYKRLIYSRVSKTLHSPAGGVTLIPLTSCEEAQCMQS